MWINHVYICCHPLNTYEPSTTLKKQLIPLPTVIWIHHPSLPLKKHGVAINSEKSESVCSRFATEWSQIDDCMSSVCDKWVKNTNLFPPTYTEIHINYWHSESSDDLPNSDIVAAAWQITAKWHRHSTALLLYMNRDRWQQVESTLIAKRCIADKLTLLALID